MPAIDIQRAFITAAVGSSRLIRGSGANGLGRSGGIQKIQVINRIHASGIQPADLVRQLQEHLIFRTPGHAPVQQNVQSGRGIPDGSGFCLKEIYPGGHKPAGFRVPGFLRFRKL